MGVIEAKEVCKKKSERSKMWWLDLSNYGWRKSIANRGGGQFWVC